MGWRSERCSSRLLHSRGRQDQLGRLLSRLLKCEAGHHWHPRQVKFSRHHRARRPGQTGRGRHPRPRHRRHQDRRRVYHNLAAELELSAQDDAACRALRAKMIRTAGEDPHVYKAADAIAFNGAVKSLGCDPREEFVVTPSQRRLRHIRTYSGTKIPHRTIIG